MKAKHRSLTVQGAAAMAIFAVALPLLRKAGVELDPETKQAVLLLIGSAIAYGLRRAAGGLR